MGLKTETFTDDQIALRELLGLSGRPINMTGGTLGRASRKRRSFENQPH